MDTRLLWSVYASVIPAAAGAVGGGQGGAALLTVPGDGSILTGAAHAHGEDAGGVAVTVAVVLKLAAIATGPHVDAAQTIATLHCPLLNGSACERTRTINCLTVIIRTPAGGVDVYSLGVERQGPCLHCISDGPIQHPHSANTSIEGNTNGAEGIVGLSGHLSGTSGSMLVGVKQVISMKR